MADRSIKAWEPGDGLRCRWAGKAPREVPCGPPVATVTQHDFIAGPGRGKTCRSYVVCQNHVPGVLQPNQIRARADKVAKEKVLAEHWDEYRAALQAEAERIHEAQVAELPEPVQELIRKGGRSHYGDWLINDDDTEEEATP